MELVIVISILIAVVSIFVSCLTIRRVKRQISEMTDALADIKNGNGNRRILSAAMSLSRRLRMKSMKLLCLMRVGFLRSTRQRKQTDSL